MGLWQRWLGFGRAEDKRPTVRRQLALTLALAVAPAGVLAVADAVRAYHAARTTAERSHMSEVILAAQAERDAFVGIRHALEALAVTPAIRQRQGQDCNATMHAWVASSPTFALGVVLDTEGRITCASVSDIVGQDSRHDARLSAFRADPRFTVDALASGPITGEPVVLAYVPVWGGGELSGIIAVSVRTAALAGIGLSGHGRVQPHHMALVNARGDFVLGMSNGEAAAETAGWLPPSVSLRRYLTSQPEIFTHAVPRDTDYVLTAAPLVSQRVWLVAAAPAEAVYAGVLARAAVPIAAPLLMWLLAIGVAYYAIDRLVVQHMVYLARITRAYGRGRLDLRPRATATAPHEIAMLADDLATMAERLDTREGALREAAEAKRVLLMEVYHRVKNNLQMISSLLSLQRRRATTDAERTAIARIESRVHSLSLVHQRLYTSDDLNRVDMNRLCSDVIASLAGLDQAVEITTDLDAIVETADRATPTALLLNEALTNALKYARRGGGKPRIRITMKARQGGGFTLDVANDAAEATAEHDASIGARLMAGFARQLRATLTTRRVEDWYVVTLSVPPLIPSVDRGVAAGRQAAE